MKQIKTPVQALIKDYLLSLEDALHALDKDLIEKAIFMVMDAYLNDKNVFIIGNGGGAASASHMACDLSKGTLARHYNKNEKRLKVISLSDNISVITAYANDLSYNEVFVQQLRNLVNKEDLIIVLSGSGNSRNVVKAVRYAKTQGAKTIGLLGFTGGKLAKMVDCAIIVKSNNYGPVEDVHVALHHIITACFAKLKREYEGVSLTENMSTPYANKSDFKPINKRHKKR
jgi:D-sedoheptulose 7-phosphate isomerase